MANVVNVRGTEFNHHMRGQLIEEEKWGEAGHAAEANLPPNSNSDRYHNEEGKEDDDDLGSELSGCSADVPEEITCFEKSGSYLETYERRKKEGFMVSKSMKVQGKKIKLPDRA